MFDRADIAVIGAGIVGLSTAFALTEQGASVAIYERGVPGNAQSGGESRIFRHAHDDRRMVALAREARGVWREWEERFGQQLLSRDGVISIGSAVDRRLAILLEAGGVRVGRIGSSELADALPLLAAWDGPAMLDEDGGVIRARAVIAALTGVLAPTIVAEEVVALRVTSRGSVEVRTGGATVEHDRAVLCAGRGSAALARGAGIPLPVRQAVHARLTYRLRGDAPERLPCLLAGDGTFGEPAYADAMPGNEAYAVGLGDSPDPRGRQPDRADRPGAGHRAHERLRQSCASRTRSRPDRGAALLGHRASLAPRRNRGLGGRGAVDPGRREHVQARAAAGAAVVWSRARRGRAREPAPAGQPRR